MTLWFTSDTHFSHKNIIEYCSRPFKDVIEMDDFMISQWNTYVKSSDHIYHLGDVSMKRPNHIIPILNKLNGHKRLVRGNHDIFDTKEYQKAGFEEIYGVRVIDNLLMTHIPVHPSSMGKFKANIHGHIHNNQPLSFPPVGRIDKATQAVTWQPYVNISVEVTNYHPVSLEDLKVMIGKAI